MEGKSLLSCDVRYHDLHMETYAVPCRYISSRVELLH